LGLPEINATLDNPNASRREISAALSTVSPIRSRGPRRSGRPSDRRRIVAPHAIPLKIAAGSLEGDYSRREAGLEPSGGASTMGLLSEPFRHPIPAAGEPDLMEGFEMRVAFQ
jgi:hypothetical protein